MRDAHAAAKIGDGYQTVRACVGVDELRGCIPGLRLISEIHCGVVEEEDHIAGLRVCGTGALLEGEAGERLLLAVFPNLEVFLSKVADVVALLVGHHSIDEYQTRLCPDDVRFGRGRSG